MTKELSPSEYEEIVSTRKAKSTANTNYVKYGVIAVVALMLCAAGFGAGVSYQNGKQSNTTAANSDSNGQFPSQRGRSGGMGSQNGPANGQRPNVGQVTAVSADSISISNTRSGSNQTFKITSSTAIQNNSSAASTTDIKSGDTVFIITDTSDASTAIQIMLNPNFGGGRPMSAPQPTSDGGGESI